MHLVPGPLTVARLSPGVVSALTTLGDQNNKGKVIMRIKEAILKGIGNTKQAFGTLKDAEGNTCGMGAMFEGAFGDTIAGALATDVRRKERLPGLDQLQRSVCPICGLTFKERTQTGCNEYIFNSHLSGEMYTQSYLIPHLNDNHRMSREGIAELVDTLELQELVDVDTVINTSRVSSAISETNSESFVCIA